MTMWSFMLFEEAGVHLMWCFENEKKGLSYIWKCPGNEQRVKKSLQNAVCSVQKAACYFMSHFYSLTGFPGEIQVKRFEIHQVERLNMSGVWITEARSSSYRLISWLEHFTNEWRLMITVDASDSRNINAPPRGSKYFTTLNINGEASL